MKRWWVRWECWEPTNFEYNGPWWESGVSYVSIEGEEFELAILVAAVVAKDEESARDVIRNSHDEKGSEIREFSFTNERSDDWEPFGDRFKRQDWMIWPYPVQPCTT